MGYHIYRPATRDEWLEARKEGIGGSDAGTIMGVSPFSTPLKLYRQKKGLIPPPDETKTMRMGHSFEFATTDHFIQETGAIMDWSSEGDWLAIDDERPHLRLSPDRLYWPAGTPEAERTPQNWQVLECKSTNKPVDRGDLPLYWVCQLQYQMGLLGAKRGALCWVSSSPKLNMDFAMIDFNPQFYETLVGMIDRFWQDNIVAGVEPEAVTAEDLADKYPHSVKDKGTQASLEDRENCAEWLALSAQKESVETRMGELELEIKRALGDSEYLYTVNGDTGEVTPIAKFKSVNQKNFDEEKFRAENPEVYESFMTKTFDKAACEKADRKRFAKYVSTSQGSRRFSVCAR